jgi:transposase-like protein
MKKTSSDLMAGLRGPEHWKPDDARRVLADWARSGESMAEFAHRHGINPERISWWRERLASKTSATVTLVPVTVRDAVTLAPKGAALSLVLADDVRVEVADPSRVSPQWFAAVVDALSRRSA